MAEIVYAAGIEVAAPIERVFAYRLDFENLPAYNPSVSNLRRTDSGTDPGAGAEYAFDLVVAEGYDPIETPLRVLEAVPPELIVIETGPGFLARESARFETTETGTLVAISTTLTFDGDVDEEVAATVRAQGLGHLTLELDLIKRKLES